jgi:glycosyltransferase involved in cell wall biosynthesis
MNALSSQTDLYIFSDGWVNEIDKKAIEEVREFAENIKGFKKVIIKRAERNKGLANSIIEGVSDVLKRENCVIVLEDDLIVAPNFLIYMNSALNYYKQEREVFSISGYTFPFSFPKEYKADVFFTKRASSWGWATWNDRWCEIDWQVISYEEFAGNNRLRRSFDKMGTDLSSMLDKQMRGTINSWAIRWSYHQFKNNLYSVYPVKSKVRNIGFGKGATHTSDYFNRYETVLDTSGKKEFSFADPHLNKKIIKRFIAKYSLYTRAKFKILNVMADVLRLR